MVGTRVPRNTAKSHTERWTTQDDKLQLNSIHFLEIGKAGLSGVQATGRRNGLAEP